MSLGLAQSKPRPRVGRLRSRFASLATLLALAAIAALLPLAAPAEAQSANNAPTVANDIPDQTATPGFAFSYAFPANTFDDADGDALTYTATTTDGSALPSWLTFTAATRAFSGAPQLSDTGTVSVKVTASDGNGGTVSDTFDITVSGLLLVSNTGQNTEGRSHFSAQRAQPFTTGASAAGYTLTAVSFPIGGTATGSSVSVRIERSTNNRPGGSLGSLTLSEKGSTVTGTSPGIDLDANTTYFVVLTGVFVDASNTYRRTASNDDDPASQAGWSLGGNSLRGDMFSLTDTTSWQIAIGGSAKNTNSPNNAPTVANEIPDQTATPGTAFSYAFPSNTFNDADGDALTYTATRSDGSALPSWLTFTAATRAFSGTPKMVETVSVTVTAGDGAALVSDTFDITVTGTLVSNTGQSFDGTSNLGTRRAQSFRTGSNAAGYTLTGVSFPITGSSTGSSLSVRIERSTNNRPGSSLGSLTLSQSGSTVTGTSPGINLAANTTYFVVLAGTNANDVNVYHRTNSDGEDDGAATGWSIGDTSLWTIDLGETSATSWQLAIIGSAKGVNSAPTVENAIPDQVTPLTAFYYVFPANTFSDADAGTTLTYTATRADGSALPSWLTFTGATRAFSGTPQSGDAGTVSVKVTASDGNGGTVSDTFDITVDITAIVPVTETLVSNTGKVFNVSSHFGTRRAQPFSTGSNAAGYTLTGVSFPITGDIPTGLSVRIERSTNNRPGGSLGSLTLTQSGSTVTGTSPRIDLAADTTYFVVLTGTNVNPTNVYHLTTSNGEDDGAAAGWSIGDTSLLSDSLDTTSNTSWKLAISGSVNINEGVQSAEVAYANGATTLTLTFDRGLAALGALTWEQADVHFAISVDGLYQGGNRGINLHTNRIKVSGPRLILTFNGLEALPGREVVVRYNQAWSNEHVKKTLKYAADDTDVASFTQTVTRLASGPIAPLLTEGQVAGNVLTLTFDRALDTGSAPAGRRFRVLHRPRNWEGEVTWVHGTGTATVSGNTVTVALASKVPQRRYALVSYSKGDDASPLRGASAGPQVTDIWGRRAAVLDRDAPQQTGSLLAGTSLVLYYDEKLDTSSTPTTGSYTVETAGNNPQGVTVSGVSVHPNAVELTLGAAPATNVDVTYTPPGMNPVQDAAGNDAGSLTSLSVTRQASDPGAPEFQSASAAADALTVSFTQNLDPAHVPAASAFTLSMTNAELANALARGGIQIPSVTGVVVRGTDVELTVNPWWYPCDGSLTVAYAKPTGAASRLQNNWGSEADAFTRTATNSGKDGCVFPVVWGSVQAGGQSGDGPQGASGNRGRTTTQSYKLGDASQQPAEDASRRATRIVLEFERALSPDRVPAEDAFTVTTHTPGTAPVEVTDVEVPDGADDKLLLPLSRQLADGEQVTVNYRRPHGASGLWDAQNNQVANFSVDVKAPATAPPVFSGEAQRLDNALPGLLVSLPLRQSDFSDPDGDPLAFTLSASRDDVYASDGDVPGGFMYSDKLGRVFFLAKTTCALATLDPPTGDAYYTVVTMTATDPGGTTAHATATFRTDPAAFGCPSLSSATADSATVTMVFDADLAPSYTEPTAHEFVVKVDGVAVSVTEVALAVAGARSDSRDTITLTLASPVSAGQSVAVSYAPGGAAVAAAFADRPATNDTPARQDDYEPDQELIDDVWGYARETQHGFDHILRWMRVLQSFGALEAMTANEAQGYADVHISARWDPVAQELRRLESASGTHEPDQLVIADMQSYARETQHGFDHVLRWMRALKTLGAVADMTAAEAQDNADRFLAERWGPVAEELEKLKAPTSDRGVGR